MSFGFPWGLLALGALVPLVAAYFLRRKQTPVINYVSSPKDMQRELEAFDSMIRADPRAIHELYLLDGTLVKRFVPAGVSVP
jgi:hypothetical protein